MRSFVAVAILMAGLVSAQPEITLKTRRIQIRPGPDLSEIRSPRAFGRGHLLLQFDDPPTAETVAELERRGVAVLQDVPGNGLIVSVSQRVSLRDLRVRFASPFAPSDKISPALRGGGFLLVEFHPDVDLNEARSLVLNLGLELRENPDLGPHHLMIRTSDPFKLAELARLDEVAYVFPASDDLARGLPVHACSGALTVNGPTAQSIPTYGDGWDGPGLGAVTLSFVFSAVTAQLPAASTKAEVQRAMSEWSKAVSVTWTPGTSSAGRQTVNILWGSYSHGDAYPFDGPGGVLAHTFYPSPPNPEPIAGDMHLDDSESWRIGANTDLFSVALHELGHALGLGHSDDPNAVMYPYYRITSGLSPTDIDAVKTLYAASATGGGTPETPSAPLPLTLAVNVPPATTTSATLNLSGSTSGGKGTIVVSWATDRGASGVTQGASTSWVASNIPLATGANTITVRATDEVTQIVRSITVTRQVSAPTPSPKDTTPPSLTIQSPAATTVSTSASSLMFSGTASDNVGVTGVLWSTNTGRQGSAMGSTAWTAYIPILVGSNMVTIRARDAAGNVAWRTVMVSRH